MFSHDNGRRDFITYTVARAITHLRGASVEDHNNAVAGAQTLANFLELAGLAAWPRATYTQVPRAEQAAAQAAALAQQQSPQPTIAGTPPPAASTAAENTAKLLASLGAQAPQAQPLAAPGGPSVGTGTVIGGNGGPPQGTPGNPATSGAVIAAHGEVQGQREVVVGPTVSPSGIVSDVQAVRTPGQ